MRLAGRLEELGERGDSLPGAPHRRLEAVVAEGEAGVSGDVDRKASAFGPPGGVADEERDEQREYGSENVGIHGVW